MKPLANLSRRALRGLRLLGAFCAVAGSASAQVGQLAAPVLNNPVFKAAKPGPGGTLVLPSGASVQLNQRGGYLLSAVVMLVNAQNVKLTVVSNSPTATVTPATGALQVLDTRAVATATQLLGVISGFGDGLAQPLTQFLSRPDVVQRLPGGVKVVADPFVIGAQTQGKLLRLTIAPQQVPAGQFRPAAHVQPARQPGAVPVALRVYSDFQCPYCEQFETQGYPGVLKQLPADVSVEFHQFPLESIHPLARPAAEASECAAQQGKFWPFKELLFADRSWLSGNPNQVFISFADRLGLRPEAFKTCLAERGGKAAVDAGVQEALQVGVNATPTVFVNGLHVANPYDVASLLKLIQFARVAASAPAAQLNPPLLPAPKTPGPAGTGAPAPKKP
ncbi:DsbA family protein [Deinococcus sp.]|uniref:DsbA family protein n=1 Tax=Deinococcus sp. TaxID=47478 RepID=UPI0025BE0CE7|nr:DsbA family protein [Deinococcus sp.]